MKVVFNGNGYDPAWPEEAKAKGLFALASGVDAICTLVDAKNVEMFSTVGVFTPEECEARKIVSGPGFWTSLQSCGGLSGVEAASQLALDRRPCCVGVRDSYV